MGFGVGWNHHVVFAASQRRWISVLLLSTLALVACWWLFEMVYHVKVQKLKEIRTAIASDFGEGDVHQDALFLW
jgi:hypothetical protein